MILPMLSTSLYSLTFAKHLNCGTLFETHQLQEKLKNACSFLVRMEISQCKSH